jgi:hypothetical protein
MSVPARKCERTSLREKLLCKDLPFPELKENYNYDCGAGDGLKTFSLCSHPIAIVFKKLDGLSNACRCLHHVNPPNRVWPGWIAISTLAVVALALVHIAVIGLSYHLSVYRFEETSHPFQ